MMRLKKTMVLPVGAIVLMVAPACTPEELAVVEQAIGADLGTVEQVNTGCIQAFGAGSEEQGGACWQIGVDLVADSSEQAAPEPQVTNASRWDRIARCESGGRWDYPPVTNNTGTYSGGLMIGHRWWPAYGGEEFATYPYQASKAEQIAVAERIWADNGADAWDCK